MGRNTCIDDYVVDLYSKYIVLYNTTCFKHVMTSYGDEIDDMI